LEDLAQDQQKTSLFALHLQAALPEEQARLHKPEVQFEAVLEAE
jgi:hypothetical protein